MSPEQRLNQLNAAEAAGADLDVMAFWGHKPTPSGAIGPGCLSQWWPAPFVVDGVAYPTAEHWMMAGKARLFDDPTGLATVLAARGPGAAKAAGRRVQGFDERRWTAARYRLVVAGNRAKFTQHPDLRRFLLATGERVLVEASPRDRIWGIGMAPTNPLVQHPSAWRGLNLLGFALMDVRDQLRADPPEDTR
ncbi:MAG: NADAR family protein [Dactylosporangium sp.]|nr:NADAR family protein [Dactylosporangium sp.]NNJ59656.1 NADAR family protein [Dactylosporangium sp.]